MRNRLLDGRTAIVTGGASGIGRAIAVLFHAQGARVLIADLNRDAAEAAATALGQGAAAIGCDVTDSADVGHAVAAALALGAPDILVNCAGVPQLVTPIEDMDESVFDRILSVNLRSVFLTVKHVVPHMKRGGGGAIVNIASVVAVRPKPGLGAYCASKGAVITLSRSLALELAPHGIRVNVIAPGPAETPMLGQFMEAGADLDQGRRAFASVVPLGSLVQPDDVAEAALYLASPLSRIVTGAVHHVDGGRSV